MKTIVIMLADLRGTKTLLAEYLKAENNLLEQKLFKLQSCYSRVFLKYIPHSRSINGAMFSDSVFAQWNDEIEAAQYAPRFAMDLWQALRSADLPVRIFLDKGHFVPEHDDLGNAIEQALGKLKRITPVSTAIWSVSVGEASGFAEGLYFGESFLRSLTSVEVQHAPDPLRAGPFWFYQITGPYDDVRAGA